MCKLWENHDLLMSDEDLEAGDNLGQRDGAVALPVLDGLGIINKDDEILVRALEEDLGLSSVSTRHGECGLKVVVLDVVKLRGSLEL